MALATNFWPFHCHQYLKLRIFGRKWQKSAVTWGMPTLDMLIPQALALMPQTGFKSEFLVVYGYSTRG